MAHVGDGALGCRYARPIPPAPRTTLKPKAAQAVPWQVSVHGSAGRDMQSHRTCKFQH